MANCGRPLRIVTRIYKTARLPALIQFILNRHVIIGTSGPEARPVAPDESAESPCQPTTRKMIYEIFRLADRPNGAEAFAFAPPSPESGRGRPRSIRARWSGS